MTPELSPSDQLNLAEIEQLINRFSPTTSAIPVSDPALAQAGGQAVSPGAMRI